MAVGDMEALSGSPRSLLELPLNSLWARQAREKGLRPEPWGPCGPWHWDSHKSQDEPRHQHGSEQEPRAPAVPEGDTGTATAAESRGSQQWHGRVSRRWADGGEG